MFFLALCLVTSGCLKQMPDEYRQLDEETREMIRKSLRTLPMNLKEIGYELYTKSF